MYNNLLEARPKSDIVFYRAFKQATGNKQAFAILKALLLASMVTLIILSYAAAFVKSSNDQIQAFVINAVVSLFGVFLQIVQLCIIYTRPQVFLRMAETNMHVILEELTLNVVTIQDCVSSKIFIATGNLIETDLNEPTKKAYINATSRAIALELSVTHKGIASLTRLHSILSIVSIVNSIIILAQIQDMDSLNKSFLIAYVVLVGLSELFVILVFILIILSPLLCCLCCTYICCCRKPKGEGISVAVKNANMEDILNCDGTCSICYQNIGQNQQVYVLPCSFKHVFHKDCLGHWAKVKNTCPICRAQIPMESVPINPPNDQ